MRNNIAATLAALFVFTVCFNGVLTAGNDDYLMDPNSKDVRKAKDEDKKYSYLWFGPRMGRRKRNPTAEILKGLDREELETLMETLKNSPWSTATLNNELCPQVTVYEETEDHARIILHNRKENYLKDTALNYTPRLGRDSGEEIDDSNNGDFISQRSPPFAPRLGRHLSPYSPRLGRELVIEP
ncbi:hypothetical protein NQ318_001358 [Aromia moschata]|uniref:Pheromone biosynthesis activating neuropeptide n=1 Tax=Aromia moschata TaxID=1265417 RepID=A0AAV8YVK5_9CUCU|nr:hypothetical protein NQ318_001358 [Aromia moschata]